MSQVEVWEDLTPSRQAVPEIVPEIVMVPVAGLRRASSLRSSGVCADHVDRLVASGGAWPPILVGRVDRVVIDGAHRVAAARRLGIARVEAVLFDGDAEAAFVEFVRRNVTHGLTLTLAERKQAAVRVLREHGSWSDRRVAEVCALSPKTVALLRTKPGVRPSEEGPHPDGEVREGRDHRRRPVNRGSVRARVVDALQAQPDASLRTIATAVGVSPETVRLVRMNLEQPTEPWQVDTALASSDDSAAFLAWFEQTAVSDPDLAWAGRVPLGRVYVVADEARRRSETWLQLARALEARTRPR